MKLAVAVLVIVCVAATAAAAPPRTRAEFARALATIQPGTLAADARALLGPPDDVRTERDPGGISAARTLEVWRWGTSHHLGFATLGTIHVQADGTIQYVFGGQRTPPAGFAEPELRTLLELIDAVPSYNDTLEPLALIRAVDALQPLGKARALDAIDEYLRVSSFLDDRGREGVFLLLRALFDPPAAGMPPMMVGSAVMPTDPKALPRFPLVIVDDVPLKLVRGYALAGEAEPPAMDVAAFRKLATLRARPLAPSAAALDAIDAYVAGPLGKAFPVDEDMRVLLYDQALRFAATVYRPADATVDGPFPFGPDLAARWKARRAELAKLRPRWNAVSHQLELPDGTTLPPVRVPVAMRVWWDLGLPGTTLARLTLERRSDTVVEVELRFEVAATAKPISDSVLLVDPMTSKVLATIPIAIDPHGQSTGMSSGVRLALPRGGRVHAVLASGTSGPLLAP